MKSLDYAKLKLDTIKDGKSQQEKAQEQLAAERKPAQDAVDTLTYSVDRSSFNKGGSESDGQKKRNPLDTHSYVHNGDEIDAKVKSTPPDDVEEEPKSKPVVSKPIVARTQSKVYDEDVEDFENSFDASDEDFIEEDVDSIPAVKPSEDSPEDEYYEEENVSNEEDYDESDYDDYDVDDEYELEQKRREAEAKLRAKTQAANQKNKPKSKSQSKSNAKGVSEDEIQYSYLRKVPKELVLRIKQQFPLADTMDEAVAAFLYLKEGKPKDILVPDKIKEVASHFTGEEITAKDAQDEILKAVMQLSFQLRALTKKSSAIELASVYMLFDYMGFRKKDQLSTSEVDFLEKGMNELITNLEKSSEVKTMKDRNRAGSLTNINRD